VSNMTSKCYIGLYIGVLVVIRSVDALYRLERSVIDDKIGVDYDTFTSPTVYWRKWSLPAGMYAILLGPATIR
jgi:hypothetical protein